MPTTIRLQRTGRKAQASFRIVVSDSAESRDGPAIETIGTYNPRTQPSLIRLDAAAALGWLHRGAMPSDTVISIFRKTGVWQKFQAGEAADTLEEPVIELGPPADARHTSKRAAMAAEAQKELAKRRVEEKAAAEVAAKKAAEAARKKKAEEKAAAEAAEEAAAEKTEVEASAEAGSDDAPAAEATADAPATETEAAPADEPSAGEASEPKE
ncbi:MAG: 30S ribosomal protein S16 [Gemmatimonadota bacterium]